VLQFKDIVVSGDAPLCQLTERNRRRGHRLITMHAASIFFLQTLCSRPRLGKVCRKKFMRLHSNTR